MLLQVQGFPACVIYIYANREICWWPCGELKQKPTRWDQNWMCRRERKYFIFNAAQVWSDESSQDLAFVNKPNRVFGPESVIFVFFTSDYLLNQNIFIARKNLFRQKVPPGAPGADSLPGYLTDLDQRPSGHQLTSPDLWVQVMWGSERVNRKNAGAPCRDKKEGVLLSRPPFHFSDFYLCDWLVHFQKSKGKNFVLLLFFTYTHIYIYIYSIAFYFITCINLGLCQWQQVAELDSLVGLYQRRAHEPSVINDSQSQWLHSFLGR